MALRHYLRRVFERRELPIVLINGAVSLDGKLALENRTVIQFSSGRDRNSVFQLRARADAVLCGAETVETFAIDLAAGPPSCRKERRRRGRTEEPLRVVVSADGNLDPQARIFQKVASPVIILTTQRAFKKATALLSHVASVKAFGTKIVSYPAALRWLRDARGVKRLVCEGGGETNAELIRAGVVDELHITTCPLILRGRHAPTICDGEGAASLNAATRLKLKTVKQVKGELFLTYRVVRHNMRSLK